MSTFDARASLYTHTHTRGSLIEEASRICIYLALIYVTAVTFNYPRARKLSFSSDFLLSSGESESKTYQSANSSLKRSPRVAII